MSVRSAGRAPRRFRAADALEAAGIPPERVRSILPRVDPHRVWVRVAPRWFMALWAPGITAVAMPWGIYVHPERLAVPIARLGTLMVHELTHIEQWRRLGPVGWAREYLGDYVAGRREGMGHSDAYRQIGLEVEARGTAHTVTGR